MLGSLTHNRIHCLPNYQPENIGPISLNSSPDFKIDTCTAGEKAVPHESVRQICNNIFLM